MPEIEFAGESLRVVFDSWNPEAYEMFLRTKRLPEHAIHYDPEQDAYTVEAPARFAKLLGVEVPASPAEWLPFPAFLWDYQRHFLKVALEAKRYALFWDTGLGKTPTAWEWCRQVQHRTAGRVLFVAPLNLHKQHLAEAVRFYGSDLGARILATRAELREWCRSGQPGIGLTNPEKFIPGDGEPEILEELTYCAGVCLDESSLLKTGGGVIKWALIKSCRGIEYKLALTATPAPNDPIEYASQASWLEKIRDDGEVIWTYFVRDADGEWKVKQHALAAFYRFLSGWSCYVRTPSRYGFRDNLKDLPAPERIVHEVAPTSAQLAAIHQVADVSGQTSLVTAPKLDMVERDRMSQLAAGFLYERNGAARVARRVPSDKPALVGRIVREEVAAGRQVLVWTNYDETAEIILEELGDLYADTLTGKTERDDRQVLVRNFLLGDLDVLITRPKVLGFGFNFQNAGAMVFADLNDSYEQVYQCERRAYRYGQVNAVRIHFPIVRELQGAVWQNLLSKRAQFEGDVARMERLYVEALEVKA